MRRLVVMRHGEAENGVPGRPDAGRRLTGAGERAARAAGRWLRDEGVAVDRVVASPASRARETARLVAKELGFPFEQARFVDIVYEAPVQTLMAIVEDQGANAQSLLLVGHNPGLEGLLRRFAPGHGENRLPPGGLVVLGLRDGLVPGGVEVQGAWWPGTDG